MPRGKRWQYWEDELIREAAGGNRALGLTQTEEKGYIRRMAAVADRTGRSVAAVRQRASRLGIRSYRRREDRRQWRVHWRAS